MEKKNENEPQLFHKKISRKEAIKKTGVAALTASSLFFLTTKSAAADSSCPKHQYGDIKADSESPISDKGRPGKGRSGKGRPGKGRPKKGRFGRS